MRNKVIFARQKSCWIQRCGYEKLARYSHTASYAITFSFALRQKQAFIPKGCFDRFN